MTAAERAAWCPYVSVIREFLGNTKASNYRNLVDVMLRNFQALGARMSIKLHYLSSHLDYFPENLGDVSEEQEERFQQDIRTMEQKYQGRWNLWQIITGHLSVIAMSKAIAGNHMSELFFR